MHANHREDIDSIGAGDIAAAVGLTDTRTGDTLCDEKDADPARDRSRSPSRSSRRRSSRRRKADQDKLGHRARRASRKKIRRSACAPTRRRSRRSSPAWASCISRSSSTACAASSRSKPTSASRRSRTKKRSPRRSKSKGSFVRQTGGKGQYGDVWIRVEPQAPGTGFVFEWKIVGGAVPKEYAKAVQEGIRESAQSGVLAGFPVLDFKADGFRRFVPRRRLVGNGVQDRRLDGVERSQPRGRPDSARADHESRSDDAQGVHGRDQRRLEPPPRRDPGAPKRRPGGAQVITANVPLSEMFGYATDMRSATQGRATYTMEFSHYEKAPKIRRGRDRRQGFRQETRDRLNAAFSLSHDIRSSTLEPKERQKLDHG